MKPDIDLIPTRGLGHVSLPAMCFRKPSSSFVIQGHWKETVSDKLIAFRECKDSGVCEGNTSFPRSSSETDVCSLKTWHVGNFNLPVRVTCKEEALIAPCGLPCREQSAEGRVELMHLEVSPLTGLCAPADIGRN